MVLCRRFAATASLLVVVLLSSKARAFVVQPRPSTCCFGRTTRLYASTSTDLADIKSMRAGEIKKELESYGISTRSMLEKDELVDALQKARADGLKPKEVSSSSSTSSTTTSSSSSASSTTTSSSSESRPREERIAEEMEKCKSMKASELKKELEELGVSTKSFFEKSEFVKALSEARVDGVSKNKAGGSEDYAEYKNVEVLTNDSAGPRPKQSQQQQQQQKQQSNPFGGGASPFGSGGMEDIMGGMGGMGGLADMLKNMGMGGGAAGANPFGGGANPFAGGANPFGGAGGMGDAMGKAQELMKNPRVLEIIKKAQSNPKLMKAVQECMGNPAAFAKYQSDPEIAEIINELRKYM